MPHGKKRTVQIQPCSDDKLGTYLCLDCGPLGEAVDIAADRLRDSMKRANSRTPISKAMTVEVVVKLAQFLASDRAGC